jgi:uncharacterized membrane protein
MNLRRTLLAAVALSVAGLGVSLYLTWVYMADAVIQCGSSGGCATVQHSAYAWVAGVPVPMLGAVAYALIIALVILALQLEQRRDLFLLALVGGSLVGVLFSAYLTYVEFFVIYAICRWCVVSAVIMVLVFALVLYAWRQHQNEE